jgi:hypothetical protein
MSPVRGRGWYKRPFRLTYVYDGRKVSKAFHWPRPWREETEWARRNRNVTEVRAWIAQKDEYGNAVTMVTR